MTIVVALVVARDRFRSCSESVAVGSLGMVAGLLWPVLVVAALQFGVIAVVAKAVRVVVGTDVVATGDLENDEEPSVSSTVR